MNNYKGFIPGLILLFTAGVLYRKYQDNVDDFEKLENEKLIRKYLLNENIPSAFAKPILWIHIPYKLNSRVWKSFGSRNTENLNEPYMYLTIKSIVAACSTSFRVCLIDDNSFGQLLPSFGVDFSKIPDPIDENIRTLSKLMILKTYGGMFVPPSFVCEANLKNVFNNGVHKEKMFFGEDVSRNSTSSIVNMFPNTQFMGCNKNCKTVDLCINYIQSLISRDSTAESRFDGNFERFIFNLKENNQANIIDGSIIGTKDSNNDPIILDQLFNDTPIELSPNATGVLIPHDELLRRIKYKYFVYLSIPEILDSETFIGKYINNHHNEI